MKESHRLRIERHLAEFAAWRASGLTLQAFVQQRGEELTVWRARLTWCYVRRNSGRITPRASRYLLEPSAKRCLM